MLCIIFLTFISFSINVSASASIEARIGNQYFENLEDAINAASSRDTITLTSNVSLDKTLEIHKTVNINLNGNNISAEEKVFQVQGGSLNLRGTGKVIETKPNYGAITLLGSDDPSKKDFTTASIDSGITLEGWSGIFINHNNKTGYGILVNMNGSINAVDDINGGPGAGIYVNGYIQNEENSPIINLTETTKITSTGNGIYAAGYAIYNINGAYISGDESGLGIKSGVFNILDGTIISEGPDKTPTSGNNNGINSSGTAIQIESNAGYKGDIELNIKNGLFRSKNSNTIYEYTVKKIPTKVKNININGGTYTSNAGKPVFLMSESFNNTHSGFISGGIFSSDPTNYLKAGYSTEKDDNYLYRVINNTMQVFGRNEQSNTRNFLLIIIIFSLIIIGIITYLNRSKIYNLIKNR